MQCTALHGLATYGLKRVLTSQSELDHRIVGTELEEFMSLAQGSRL